MYNEIQWGAGMSEKKTTVEPSRADIETAIQKIMAKISHLKVEIFHINKKIPVMREEIFGLNTEMVRLNAETLCLDTEYNHLDSEISQQEKALSNIGADVAFADADPGYYDEILIGNNNYLNWLRFQLNKIPQDFNEKKVQLNKVSQDFNEKKVLLREVSGNLNSKGIELYKSYKKLEKLQLQLKILNKNLNSVNGQPNQIPAPLSAGSFYGQRILLVTKTDKRFEPVSSNIIAGSPKTEEPTIEGVKIVHKGLSMTIPDVMKRIEQLYDTINICRTCIPIDSTDSKENLDTVSAAESELKVLREILTKLIQIQNESSLKTLQPLETLCIQQAIDYIQKKQR